jgi:nitroimidazol reductase NimA-like FMN-containing flavoprotein (pyridoxamine 5'-phosphate oxidase superfamily)
MGTGFTVIPEDECRELLGSSPVGRIFFTDDGAAAVRPVTFVLQDSAIFFRTAAGSKLLSAARGSRAGFEVDDYEPRSGTGWSVIAGGSLRLVQDPERSARVDAVLRPWMPGELLHLVSMSIESVSGRRIGAQ